MTSIISPEWQAQFEREKAAGTLKPTQGLGTSGMSPSDAAELAQAKAVSASQKMWSREVNQSLLSRFGFTGTAGPAAGYQGEKFLDTLPLAKQYEYTQARRGYTGEQNYTRSTLRELENNLFQQFFNPTPTKNATNNAITTTATTQAAKKGRSSTIMSDFAALETPTNVQRKTLLGQ